MQFWRFMMVVRTTSDFVVDHLYLSHTSYEAQNLPYVFVLLKHKRAKMALHRSPDYHTSFEATGLLFQEKNEVQYRFSRWRPSGISNQNDLRYFDLQVTLILLIKLRANWPFGSG